MILPSRRALAKEFGVDLNTLQRAIAPLLADGSLQADAGRATYVNERPALKSPLGRVADMKRSQRKSTGVEGARIGIVAKLDIRFSRFTEADDVYSMLGTIERSLAPQGVVTTVSDVSALGQRDIRTVDAMRSLVELGVDGIIVLTVAKPDAINYAKSLRIPVVFTGPEPITERIAYIHYDNHDAGYQAASHLIEKGCRNLLYFASRSADWVQRRLDGARAAAAASTVGDIVITAGVSGRVMPEHDLEQIPDAREYASSYMPRMSEFDGVIAANDNMALGLLEASREIGLSAPDNFLLIGFDDARRIVMESGITSIRPPFEQMAAEAAAMTLHGLSGGEITKHTTFFANLIPRDSTYRRAIQRATNAAQILVGD
jgi:LacI family transcriptional regulator